MEGPPVVYLSCVCLCYCWLHISPCAPDLQLRPAAHVRTFLIAAARIDEDDYLGLSKL